MPSRFPFNKTEKSDRNKVHIKYVDLNSAGVYR